jgi:hypothetical protein
MTDELRLDVVGSSFVIRDPDPERAQLLGRLWSGFASSVESADPHVVTITERPGGWAVEFSDEDEVLTADFWQIADAIRSYVVWVALDEAPSLLDLHAAVMVRGGEALLIAGRSTAGKTSLALELYERGWDCFSDDVAPVEPSTGDILAFPAPVRVRDPERWETLRSVWGPGEAPPPRSDGFQLPATALNRQGRSRAAPTRLVFLSSIHEMPIGLKTITAAEAAAEAGRFVTGLDGTRFQLLRELCERCATQKLSAPSASQAAEMLMKPADST